MCYNTMMQRIMVILLVATVAVFCQTQVVQAAALWNGSVSNDFNDANNWEDDGSGATPKAPANQHCFFYKSGASNLNMDVTADIDLYSLRMNWPGSTSDFTIGSTGGHTISFVMSNTGRGLQSDAGLGTMTVGANILLNTSEAANHLWTINSDVVVDGDISALDSQRVEKYGSATLFLNGTNSYTSTTVAREGTLAGSAAFSGSVSVNAGATLAPGDGIGTMTVSGSNVELDAGALLSYELGAIGASDLISASSSELRLNGLELSDITFATSAGFGAGVYTLIDAGSVTGSLGSNVTGVVGGLQSTLSVSGNDLILTAVPEPGTIMLISLGVMGMLAYAWRKRK